MNDSGQKLWGLLLVVDSFFVVIFGGALAAKVYEGWQEPAHFSSPALRPPKVRLIKKIVETPPLKSTATLAAVKQTPAPALKTPIFAAAPTQKKKNPPQPRAQYREPKIFPSRGTEKARAVEFRYYGKKARRVFLIASFLHGGKKPLRKTKRGPWKSEVYLMPGKYRYQFMADGKKILDPRNPRHKDGFSFFSLEK